MCSTPCGINGRTTRATSNAQRRVRRAQRLAASTEEPRSRPPATCPAISGAQRLAASTEEPLDVGLKFDGPITRAQRLAASTEEPPGGPETGAENTLVLNALRHQRKNHRSSLVPSPCVRTCSTPCGINGRTTSSTHSQSPQPCCAQRLAASTEEPRCRGHHPQQGMYACSTPCGINGRTTTYSYTAGTLVSKCSTPCGINGRTTARSGVFLIFLSPCSTPCGINGRTTRGVVPDDCLGIGCSTPCGINGRTTLRRPDVDEGLAVLNALRHQRKNHLSAKRQRKPIFPCSTPCGINGRTTAAHARNDLSSGACSTPCGINGRTTPLADEARPWERCAQRLAASTEEPQSPTALRPRSRPSAQRLAASTEEPLAPVCEGAEPEACSTPCGINGRTTVNSA